MIDTPEEQRAAPKAEAEAIDGGLQVRYEPQQP